MGGGGLSVPGPARGGERDPEGEIIGGEEIERFGFV